MTVQEIKNWYKEECGKEIPSGWDTNEKVCLDFIAKDCYYSGYNKAKERFINHACECFELAEDWQAWANCDFDYAKSYFCKILEEYEKPARKCKTNPQGDAAMEKGEGIYDGETPAPR